MADHAWTPSRDSLACCALACAVALAMVPAASADSPRATSARSGISSSIKATVRREVDIELNSFLMGVEHSTGGGKSKGGKGHTNSLELLGEEVAKKLKGKTGLAGTPGIEGPVGPIGSAGTSPTVSAGTGLSTAGGTLSIELPFSLSDPLGSSLASFANSGTGAGVSGTSAGGDGVLGTDTASTGAGVVGVGNPPALAGEFLGNVSVTGSLAVHDPVTGTIALEPGWSATSPPIVIEDPVGLVQLEGAIVSTETARIGTIPAGFLPSEALNGPDLGLVAAACNKGICAPQPVSIDTSTGVISTATSVRVPKDDTLYLTGLSYLD